MLTILGSLIGFLSSSLPDFLNIFRERQDRKHELTILKMQMEQQRLGHTQRLEEIEVEADSKERIALLQHDSQPSGVGWVDGLRASVRPIITYGFFLLFVYVKTQSLSVLLNNGLPFDVAVIRLWDGETQALFAAIISYWFGSRSLSKFRSPNN